MSNPHHEPPSGYQPSGYQPPSAYEPPGVYPPTPEVPGQNGYPAPTGYQPPGGYGPAYQLPPAYGVPPPAGYAMPYYSYPYPPSREHEGLAIASLVVSCAAVLGLCTWGFAGVLGIVGAILGHVARSRLKHNGKAGGGMALAGIIVGWVLTAVCAALVVVMIVLFVHDNGSVGTPT